MSTQITNVKELMSFISVDEAVDSEIEGFVDYIINDDIAIQVKYKTDDRWFGIDMIQRNCEYGDYTFLNFGEIMVESGPEEFGQGVAIRVLS